MKRFINVLLLFLLGLTVALFAVANRQPVRFVLDPLMDRDRASFMEAPLFAFLFAALFVGILIGAAAMRSGQERWRKKAEEQEREAALWKREADNLKKGIAQGAAAEVKAKALRSYI